MEVFELATEKDIDNGAIFVRDRDHDNIVAHKKNDILMIVSDQYDFEMTLLPGRVFDRLFSEFVKKKSSPEFIKASFEKLVSTSARIGALRKLSKKII